MPSDRYVTAQIAIKNLLSLVTKTLPAVIIKTMTKIPQKIKNIFFRPLENLFLSSSAIKLMYINSITGIRGNTRNPNSSVNRFLDSEEKKNS